MQVLNRATLVTSRHPTQLNFTGTLFHLPSHSPLPQLTPFNNTSIHYTLLHSSPCYSVPLYFTTFQSIPVHSISSCHSLHDIIITLDFHLLHAIQCNFTSHHSTLLNPTLSLFPSPHFTRFKIKSVHHTVHLEASQKWGGGGTD